MSIDWWIESWAWVTDNLALIGRVLGQHLVLSLVPVVASFLLAIVIGYLVFRTGPVANPVLAVFGAIYSIPSLALFVAMPLLISTQILSPLNVIVALTIYTTALLSRSVVEGLQEVPHDVKQTADALGYGRVRRLFGVELPLAMPVIFAGLRVATMSCIALTSISILIGAASLGTLFQQGFNRDFLTPVWVGLVLSIAVALIVDGIILLIQRGTLPWARRKVRTA